MIFTYIFFHPSVYFFLVAYFTEYIAKLMQTCRYLFKHCEVEKAFNRKYAKYVMRGFMVTFHEASSFNKINRAQTGVKWSLEIAKFKLAERKIFFPRLLDCMIYLPPQPTKLKLSHLQLINLLSAQIIQLFCADDS